MNAVFVDLLHLFNDPHGIFSLTAVMKKHGARTAFIGTRDAQAALRQVRRLQPDLLLYSAFSATIPEYVRFDAMIKKEIKVPSLIGGPGPTYEWTRLASSTIDFVCLGEGERAIEEFMSNGLRPVRNIFRPADGNPGEFFPLVDLNAMPFPDRSTVYAADTLLRDSPSKQVLSGRGCPFDCTYCFNHQFREMFRGCGPAVRKKTVGYLLEEIKDIRARYPLKDIVFNDDTFVIDKKWFLEFAERFPKEIGITYTCNVRANLVDEDIARALKQSGCRGVNWSIEAGDAFIRNEVLKRGMSDEQILEAARVLHRHGVLFRLGNMLGLPGESFDQMLETVALNIRVRPQFALPNIFVPYPGLELTRYAVEKGFCRQEAVDHLPRDYFTRTVMNLPAAEKTRIYKLFCLFPVFVERPAWFNNRKIRGLLFRLPRVLLRFLYEIVYTLRVASFYTPRAPFWHRCRMAKRYLLNL